MIQDQKLNQEQNYAIEFRCPQCLKLYQVDRRQIFSSHPEFDCTKCYSRFSFQYLPEMQQGNRFNKRPIKTQTFSLPQAVKLSQDQNLKRQLDEMVACPKCSTMNPRAMKECFHCGVVIEKAEMIEKEKINQTAKAKKIRTLPSLMKLWQELLGDYSNLTKHLQFVDRCEDLQALPFALKKYKDLKEVQPHDSLANQMFDSVIMRALSAQAQKYKKIALMQRFSQLPWANIFRTAPLAVGGGLLIAGLLSVEARNLAGAGVALLVLTLGVAYLVFGRLRLEDFWRS